MSQSESGRSRQRQRTRSVLLAAARDALQAGEQPTVAEVADRAGISRATAYRYFSSAEVMAHEAVLDGIAASLDGLDFDTAAGAGVEARIGVVIDNVVDLVLRNESLFRIYLRSTLSADGEARGARRMRWIGQALGADRAGLNAATAKRLTAALSLLTGIETIIVLRDVCQLDDAQIRDVASWSARALVTSALRENSSPSSA